MVVVDRGGGGVGRPSPTPTIIWPPPPAADVSQRFVARGRCFFFIQFVYHRSSNPSYFSYTDPPREYNSPLGSTTSTTTAAAVVVRRQQMFAAPCCSFFVPPWNDDPAPQTNYNENSTSLYSPGATPFGSSPAFVNVACSRRQVTDGQCDERRTDFPFRLSHLLH